MTTRLPLAMLVLLALVLSACGGGGKDDEAGPAVTLEGRAAKGIMRKAVVTVQRIRDNVILPGPLASGRTDDQGYFRLTLPAGTRGPLAITLGGDFRSRMVCDTARGCLDPRSQAAVAFGEEMALPQGFQLRALVPFAGGNQTANVTVFSELAAELAIGRLNARLKNLDAEAIAQANGEVTDLLFDHSLLEVGDNLLATEPVDISDVEELQAALAAEKASGIKLGFALAAVAHLAQESFQGDLNAAIGQMRSAYSANDGELPLTEDPALGNSIAVSTLLTATRREMQASAQLRKRNDLSIFETQLEGELLALLPDVEDTPGGGNGGGTTDSEPPAAAGDDLKKAKDLIQAFRTFLHTSGAQFDQGTGLLVDATGSLLTANLTDDGINLIGVAKELYPHMGGIISAAVTLVKDDAAPTEYDLAADPDELLPDTLQISGTIRKSEQWSRRTLTLEQGYIQGVGTVDLSLSFSPYCYWFCDASVDIDLTISGDQVDLALTSYGSEIRERRAWPRGYVPANLQLDNAQVRVTLKDENGEELLGLGGRTSVELDWPQEDYTRLPIVESMTVSGDYYDWESDLRQFNITLRYTNLERWAYQYANPKTWAQEHTDHFRLSLDMSATLRVPEPGQPAYAGFKDVDLSMGVERRDGWGADGRQWIEIGYEGEAYRFERKEDNPSRYAFYSQSGALMELLMANDGTEQIQVDWGEVTVGGKAIAEIVDSFAGPVIRYQDGAIESL